MRAHKGIPISNLYYMLAYAFEFINDRKLEDVACEQFDNALDLLAALLEAAVTRQIKQGLYREYVSNSEDLAALRGKIDMRGTIRNKMAKRSVIACEYDELSDDNRYNQAIKATCSLVLRSDAVRKQTRDALKKSTLYFSNVRSVDPSQIQWSSFTFGRENRTYRLILSICQLIIQGMLMTDASGGMVLAPYVDEKDMNKLYERFILRYYKVHHPQLRPSAPKIPWALDEEYVGTMLPTMQTDIALAGEDRFLIIDAKFYAHAYQSQENYDSKTIHSHNLYQIFSYVKNKAAQTPDVQVDGMLLYARTGDEVQPDERFVMDGNIIYVRTLDLSTTFEEISEQLDAIARLVSLETIEPLKTDALAAN